MLLVTVPEWGHVSPCLNLAAAIQRCWDPSKGELQLSLASMEQMRHKIEARGINFLGIGEWNGDEAVEYQRSMRANFDPHVGMWEKMQHGSGCIMRMLGLKMGAALCDYLAAAKQAGTLPDVIITDGLTSAGSDAAEKFQLPLAVVWSHPLTMCLMLAGYNSYNMPADVPLEFLTLNTAEVAHPLVRSCVNPLMKRAVMVMCNQVFGGARKYVRKQLGLPGLASPALRNEKDGTSSGVLSGAVGQLAVQASVPKAVYLCAVTWDTNTLRPLPPCWHMVGPLVVDRQAPNFPPTFGPEDAAVEAFLKAAADAGEPVVFTAAGSMTHLTQQQVDALLDTFTTLTAGSKPSARILWALRKDSQHLLPAHLRSDHSSSKVQNSSDGDSSKDAAAPADTTAANPSSSNSRILVSPWVNQNAVLAHPSTRVFITHGGLGSVHEALALGQAVPLVVPFSNGADHATVGQQLVNKGLGVMLKPSELSKPGRLLGLVEELLQDQEYSRRVAAVAHQWEKAGYGPKMAAEIVLDFAAAVKAEQ